jgi:Mycobacterium membrane protein
LTPPSDIAPRPPRPVRGQRNEARELITIRLQPVTTHLRTPPGRFHIYNIGTISTSLPHLDDEVEDYPDDEYEDTGADYDGYGESLWPGGRRWGAITAVVGAVVAIGAIATAVIINSGDSASTKATIGPPATRTPVISTTPRATAPPSETTTAKPSPSLRPALPPETVTTVPPSGRLPGPPLTRTPTAAPAPTAIPPSATLNPRTVAYTVTGTKQVFDLVNIVYTDARGYPRTEFNVALPWTKMVVLNPGVQTQSVIATSIYSQLNCTVVNAAGQTVVASAKNGNLATCTR